MRKVLLARELSDLLDGQTTSQPMDAIVIPTAEELLALTEAALDDVDDVLPLSTTQRDALRAALRDRVFGALSDAPAPGDQS